MSRTLSALAEPVLAMARATMILPERVETSGSITARTGFSAQDKINP